MTGSPELRPMAFARQDNGDDLDFYAPPRLVTHIDERATAALTGYYAETIPPDTVVLDLMSGWVSHLPAARRVICSVLNRILDAPDCLKSASRQQAE